MNGELFYDDEHHALRKVIEEGRGYKKTAGHLWPDMKEPSAYAKLKHAIAGTNGEVLRFGQVIEICRFNERFDALYFACDELGHKRPDRTVVPDEERRLATIIEGAGDTLRHALAALDRLKERDRLRAV